MVLKLKNKLLSFLHKYMTDFTMIWNEFNFTWYLEMNIKRYSLYKF